MAPSAKVLILPGLYNSGPGHWQTFWEEQDPHFERVQQREWDRPDRAEWVETLDRAIRSYNDNVILVAHSLATITVAYWAEHAGRTVRGALLVAPSDTERPSFPAAATGFSPIPRYWFPFPSIVVASTNDPYMSFDRARLCAEWWGSRFVSLGEAGHIRVDDGYGPWPGGLAYLDELAGPAAR